MKSNEEWSSQLWTQFIQLAKNLEKDLIKKLNAKRFLKKVNDVSALRYAIIKLKSEKL